MPLLSGPTLRPAWVNPAPQSKDPCPKVPCGQSIEFQNQSVEQGGLNKSNGRAPAGAGSNGNPSSFTGEDGI
ncbi:MAG: hypothetical protein ACO3AC_13100, partial [Hylemonella sp.]